MSHFYNTFILNCGMSWYGNLLFCFVLFYFILIYLLSCATNWILMMLFFLHQIVQDKGLWSRIIMGRLWQPSLLKGGCCWKFWGQINGLPSCLVRFFDLVIEGDNASVMHSLLPPSPMCSNLGHVLANIHALITNLHWFSVSSVRHNANSIAHALACYVKHIPFDVFLIEDSPCLCYGGFVFWFGSFTDKWKYASF